MTLITERPVVSRAPGKTHVGQRTGTTISEVISERGQSRSFAPGECLFLEGDRSNRVYVCEDGRIRIFVTMASGRELLLGRKEPGELFGELSALDHRPRSASATAEVATVVSTMSSDELLDELYRQPQLGVELLVRLAQQLRKTNARLRARNGESTLVRAGHLLIEMSSLKLRHDPSARRIAVEMTQDELAEWIGATRESVARALARLRSAGVVHTTRGCIFVDDLAGLVAIVESA